MSDVHVQVRIGAERYALPVAYVLEVGEIGELTPVPGASRATLGVRNLRGDVLPVFDLAAVLGLPCGSSARRLIVAERGGIRAGFAVDEVTEVDELPEGDERVDSALLSRATLANGSLVGVIDVDRVFDTLEQAA
ncbi:MAG: chemotaxis protein CheW [Gaiellales bacterium]